MLVQELPIKMQWNLSEFLPGKIQDSFVATITEFVTASYRTPDAISKMLREDFAQKLFQ